MGMQLLDSSICQAADNGKNECVQALLAAGADKNAKSHTRYTTLVLVSLKFDADSFFKCLSPTKLQISIIHTPDFPNTVQILWMPSVGKHFIACCQIVRFPSL